ncbi:hypothetical protein [Frigidibacter oleivorans]|uniref:hypothetical protein n=1 Tax=Frigidibacter oleivorans TaxID=2487129 RepID=UPI000F8E542C|nr:hypothetical protein [Frigidibacter oleivorans]
MRIIILSVLAAAPLALAGPALAEIDAGTYSCANAEGQAPVTVKILSSDSYSDAGSVGGTYVVAEDGIVTFETGPFQGRPGADMDGKLAFAAVDGAPPTLCTEN